MPRRERPLRDRWYELPDGTRSLLIQWERFGSFADACARFPSTPCLYTFQTPERLPLYVGKATGLRRRYSAASGALSALLGHSNALLFAAPIARSQLEFVEHTIIFWDCTMYNTRGKHTRPWPHVQLVHQFNGVSSTWGCGRAREAGARYEGPLFCGPGEMREADTAVPR